MRIKKIYTWQAFKLAFAIFVSAAVVSMAMTNVGAHVVSADSGNWSDSADTSWYNDTDTGFTIKTAAQLAGLALLVNGGNSFSGKTVTLGGDISLSGKKWTPISNFSGGVFEGIFNGSGYKVTGLTVGSADNPDDKFMYVGLFGYTVDKSIIENVSVDATIYVITDSMIFSGGLIGINNEGSVSNCYVMGNINGDGYVGGLIGLNNGTVTGCYVANAIEGDGYVGGLAGFNHGSITNCRTVNNVTAGNNSSVGGITGDNEPATTAGYADIGSSDDDSSFPCVRDEIMNCYATGNVTGGDGARVGGIAGFSRSTVTNCYATGNVTGGAGSKVGGIAGWPEYLTDCYYNSDAVQTVDGTVRQTDVGAGFGNATASGKTAAFMKSADFVSLLNGGIGFDENLYTWAEDSADANGGCPVLSDYICVTYDAHVQHTGWQKNVLDGAVTGTVDRSLRLEGIKVRLAGSLPDGASIVYQAHVQHSGWQQAVSDGETAGTAGKSLRLEALRITLKGMDGYTVKYRAYVQNHGWMDWQITRNGTNIASAGIAGTTGKALRIEAVEIIVTTV